MLAPVPAAAIRAVVNTRVRICRRAAPSAEFSVDRHRHLMSFLTMLGPSPDWNVGLSAEDLCTKDCGWVQKVVQDLIPWDAGTDSGVTYEEKIRPLTSLDHPQSPFYDPEGGSIKLVARVVIERIARKGEQCNIVPDNIDDIVADLAPEEKEEDDTPETCIYSNWSPWSACSSSTCEKGKRMRQRMLKAQLDLSVPCPDTQDFQPCMGPGCSDEEKSAGEELEAACGELCTSAVSGHGVQIERGVRDAEEQRAVRKAALQRAAQLFCQSHSWTLSVSDGSTCMMSDWITWSPCSVSCGMGTRSRERYVKQFPEDGSMCKVPTEETEKCVVNEECYTIPCLLSPWSEWSDCSVTCGKGMRTRQRMLKSAAELGDCNEELEQAEKCMLPECPIDCELTEWSQWSECNTSCGKGHMIRTRMIKIEPQFGGAACPETVQRAKCRVRKCLRGAGMEKRRWKEAREKRRSEQAKKNLDSEQYPVCRLKPWTAWTECSTLCGGGIQERYMLVKKRSKSTQFTSCKDKKELRACNVHPC
ncbi:hypothetical protein Nmel_006237 [Mimus melanotis]